jgi:hypothetical protein
MVARGLSALVIINCGRLLWLSRCLGEGGGDICCECGSSRDWISVVC